MDFDYNINRTSISQAPLGRKWSRGLEYVTPISNGASMRSTTINLAGLDGVKPVGRPVLDAASLGFKILILAEDLQSRIAGQSELVALFAGPTRNNMGRITRFVNHVDFGSTDYILTSITWDELDDRTARANVEIKLPVPIWEASGIEATGTVNTPRDGEFIETIDLTSQDLAYRSFSAPLMFKWILPAGTHNFYAVNKADRTQGVRVEQAMLTAGTKITGLMMAEAYVTQFTRVWPKRGQEFELAIKTDAPGAIRWEADAAWL